MVKIQPIYARSVIVTALIVSTMVITTAYNVMSDIFLQGTRAILSARACPIQIYQPDHASHASPNAQNAQMIRAA
jgi:hypothetical protein